MKRIFLTLIASTLWLAPHASADRLDEMISPISHFVNFEDPRINTELRPLFAYHELDDGFVTEGGDVQLYALQARIALTDNLAFIATKDGFIDFNPDANLSDETGFADLAGGFKYALYQNPEEGQIVTAALRYNAPAGNTDVFQSAGDGYIQPSFSAAYALGKYNIMAGTGGRFSLDSDFSSFYDFDLHISREIGESGFYPLVEFGLIHIFDAGNQLPIADEGQDLFNFGASGADGKTILTGTAGARYRWDENLDFGVGYQFPLNGGSGTRVLDYRIYADMIFSFDI